MTLDQLITIMHAPAATTLLFTVLIPLALLVFELALDLFCTDDYCTEEGTAPAPVRPATASRLVPVLSTTAWAVDASSLLGDDVDEQARNYIHLALA